MKREALQKELQNIIENGDDTLLETLREVAREYSMPTQFSEEDIKEFDKRREEYLLGNSKSYSWEEAKQQILQNHSAK